MKKNKEDSFEITVNMVDFEKVANQLRFAYDIEFKSANALEGKYTVLLTPKSPRYAAQNAEEKEERVLSTEEIRKNFLKEKIKMVVVNEATDYLHTSNPLKAMLDEINRYSALIDELTSKEYAYTLEEILEATIELQKED